MKLVTLSAFAVALCLLVGTASADLCSSVPTSGANVVTWTGKCQDLGSNATDCWSPSAPTITSTVVLSANATYGDMNTFFTPITVTNFVISTGATLTMGGNAIQTTGCFLVQGNLVMSGLYGTNQDPIAPYLADPSQPEGTDCLTVQVGFTPRLCGPGMLKVEGTVTVNGGYGAFTSIFQSGLVDTTGTLTLNGGFLWGNITVKGTYLTTGYSYQHGFIYNYGTANITTLAFDVWATSWVANRMPLLIENHGTLNLGDALLVPTITSYGGTYRAVLVNYASTTFYGYGGQSQYEFDIFNYGDLTWDYPGFFNFFGGGTFVNKGTIVVSNANVFLSTFHSIGGAIVIQGQGVINFGSSSTSASATMKLCQLTQGMPSNLLKTFELNSKRRVLAARHVGHNEPVIEQRGDCWWYGDFCYHSPYLWSPPVDVEKVTDVKPDAAVHASGLPLQRHGGTVRLIVQRHIAESELSLDTPCNVRYSFEKTTIKGDGSGSIIANLPVKIIGKLTLGAGAKWYVAAERRGSPFYGGGKVVVGRGATLYAGISAEFKHDGELEVLRGGQLAVPRHAQVTLSNHSVVLRHGATLHVDGTLSIVEVKGALVTVDHCGLLVGSGDVIMERDGMLRCGSKPGLKHQVKKNLNERLPRRH